MYRTAYRTVDVNGLSVFYREAGPQDAPTILLLHGFPSSSRMWQPLLDRLADRFHLLAPDYPGFGHSDAPSHTEFAYTFDHLAAVVGHFTQALGLTKYTLVMQDYGGPLGFRLAIAHPERLEALIVQNAVAHEDGLGPLWKTRREFWADRQTHEAALRGELLLLRGNAAAPRRNQPERRELRPGPVDRRARLPQQTRPAGHPDRPVLRLPHQRRELSRLAGLAPQTPAAATGHMGPLRPVIPGRGGRGIPQGRARRRDPRPRRHFALDEQPDMIADLTRRFLQRRQAHTDD
jgi:pimeloyl-ACP methyl ester carboxylesterase